MRAILVALVALSVLLPAAGAAAQVRASGVVGRFLITVRPRLGLVPPRLEFVPRDGHVIRVVADRVGDAALSPNHKWIAWAGRGGVHVESVSGASARFVPVRCFAKSNVCGGPFVWAPDGRKLLLVEGNGGLAIVSLSNGATREVVAPRRHFTYDPIAWSGTAHEILFGVNGNGAANGIGCCSEKLVVARPSGTSQQVLYSAADAIHDGPAASWSPDGKWISFTTDGRDYPTDPRLAVVQVSSGATKTVASYSGFTAPPIWKPDSSRFVVGNYDGPVDVFSSAGRRVGSIDQTGAVPVAWTRDGIYFWSGRTEVPRQVSVIPTGRRSARSVFTLPKNQVILTLESISPGRHIIASRFWGHH